MTSRVVTPGLVKNEVLQRGEICAAARGMLERELTGAAQGNLSARLTSEYRIAPTGINRGTVNPDDFVLADVDMPQISSMRRVRFVLGMRLFSDTR